MLKFSFGSFGAFPISADLVHVVSRKRLIVERNGPKFGPLVQIFRVYRVLLSVQVQFEVIQYISDFQRPCILKTADRRAERLKIWTTGVCIKCI